MVWPWPLTFRTKNVIRSSVSQDAPVTKVWRKSVNRYWRYCGNIELPRESRTDGRTDGRTHGRTTRKHIASAGAYRRRRLKNRNSLRSSLYNFLTIITTAFVNRRSAHTFGKMVNYRDRKLLHNNVFQSSKISRHDFRTSHRLACHAKLELKWMGFNFQDRCTSEKML